jgi:aminopeptidase N
MREAWRRVALIAAAALMLLPAAAHAAAERVHHDLDVHLDPAQRALQVRDRITLSGEGIALLRLAQSLNVTNASVDGAALSVPQAEHGHWVWRVGLRPGRSARVDLQYTATLQPLADIDHRGTLTGLPPMSDARGSYLPAGTGWYPEADEAAFTYRLTLQLPAGQRGLVPGRLIDEQDGPQGYRAIYDFAHPAEGIDLMAGPYVVRERMLARASGEPVRLRTWFHPEIADLADGYLQSLDAYLDLYSSWIGAYPYTEFSVVSSPLPTGFGMPTLTYLGVDVLRLPFIRATSLGHEVLHNWWGNGVYPDFARGNWSEGLTTFMADYAYREREGAAAAYEMRQGWLRDFAAIPPGEDMPLRTFTARTHGTSQIVGYHKAAFVFLMLRDQLGSQRFDAGLRDFWEAQCFRRAAWSDLQAAFERASGERLDAFFEQWLSRRGAPQVRVAAASAQQAADRWQLRVTLAQDGAPYALAMPLAIDTEAGTQMEVLQLHEAQQTFMLPLGAQPRAVRLDPQLRVFRRLDARELPPILRQVMLDPATRTQLALPSDARDAGLALATALLDHPADRRESAADAPLLIIGTTEAVDRALAAANLPARPAEVGIRGSAQVWTGYTRTGRPLAVISARDAAALQALARPLPHYGRQSWLVFEDGKAVERGVWPVQAQAVPVRLAQ